MKNLCVQVLAWVVPWVVPWLCATASHAANTHRMLSSNGWKIAGLLLATYGIIAVLLSRRLLGETSNPFAGGKNRGTFVLNAVSRSSFLRRRGMFCLWHSAQRTHAVRTCVRRANA